MPTRSLWLFISSKRFLASAVIAGGLMGLSAASLAEDLPAFRAGMWEFRRVIKGGDGKPQNLANKKCTNPTDDMKKQNDMLGKAGCTFSPVTRKGNLYTFTSDCKIQGMSSQSRSVMTVHGDGAYSIDVESRQGAQGTKERLEAKRIGDC